MNGSAIWELGVKKANVTGYIGIGRYKTFYYSEPGSKHPETFDYAAGVGMPAFYIWNCSYTGKVVYNGVTKTKVWVDERIF